MKNILVTGCCGFIGFHLCKRLLSEGFSIIGIDNMNDYYDVYLKKNRLKILLSYDNFNFEKLDIADRELLTKSFKSFQSS